MILPPSEAAPDIEALMRDDPPRRHPPEKSWNYEVQAAVSQPFLLSDPGDALRSTFVLADFGSSTDFPRHCSRYHYLTHG